jgi:hypothetical protein
LCHESVALVRVIAYPLSDSLSVPYMLSRRVLRARGDGILACVRPFLFAEIGQ